MVTFSHTSVQLQRKCAVSCDFVFSKGIVTFSVYCWPTGDYERTFLDVSYQSSSCSLNKTTTQRKGDRIIVRSYAFRCNFCLPFNFPSFTWFQKTGRLQSVALWLKKEEQKQQMEVTSQGCKGSINNNFINATPGRLKHQTSAPAWGA